MMDGLTVTAATKYPKVDGATEQKGEPMAESRGWFQALIPGEPPRATAQQKGYNRYTGQYYKKKSVLEAAEKYDFYIRQAMKEVELKEGFTFPTEAPVEVFIRFVFSTKNKKLQGEPKTTRPDCDNMGKQLVDELTACQLVKDDALIYNLNISKWWARKEEAPGVYVSLHWRTHEEVTHERL